MTQYEPSGETVTRTFRIEKEWDDILQEEANWQGTSVSALMNLIVRRYVVIQRYLDKYSTLIVEHKVLAPLLDKLSDEDISEASAISGSLLPEEALLRRGLPLDFESLVWLIEEVYGRYGCWFDVDHYVTDKENMFHLRHNIDRKWSIYISNFLSSMFKSLLDIDIKPEIREDSVTIRIPNKDIEFERKTRVNS
jgi:hypothetical protein